MRRRSACLFCLSLLIALLAGCLGVVGEHDDHAGPGWRVLGGEALARELAISPVRQAPAPFVRIGVMWEGALGSSIEISTSADAVSWSAWRRPEVAGVEAERTASFVGQVVVAGTQPARYYRVRGVQARPTLVQINPLQYAAGLVELGQPPSVTQRAAASLSFSVGTVRVNGRAAWGAREARCVASHSPARITFHHTDTPTSDSLSAPARLRQIQAYHQDTNGWCDIGYHFLITRDGQVWEGRPSVRVGAHTRDNNTDNLGVAFVGDYGTAAPNAVQMNVAAGLVAGLHQQYGIELSSRAVRGHRDYVNTGCPGQGVYFNIVAVIARASQGNFAAQPSGTSPGLGDDQRTTAGVKGIIYQRGNIARGIAGVTVTIGGQSTTTDASGVYTLGGVPIGAELITATHPSYQRAQIHRYIGAPVTWGSIGLTPLAGGDPTGGAATLRPEVERWRALVDKHFKAEHVTWALHVMDCESRGDPNARNGSSGASGLFQHLPQYWADRAANAGYPGYSPFHGEANIAASAYLLYRAPGAGPHNWVCTYAPFEDWSYRPGAAAPSPPSPPPPAPPPAPSYGCHVGSPFGYDFCSASCPCNIGQGDCDSDADCVSGLVCSHGVGAKYGAASFIDVCEPPSYNQPPPAAGPSNCHVGPLFGLSFCSATCPCGEGQGDCDSDGECKTGLICAPDVGASYGTDPAIDVCQRPGAVLPTPPPGAGGSCSWNGGSNYRRCRDCGWQFCLKSGVWSSQCEAAPLVFGCSAAGSICGADARCY